MSVSPEFGGCIDRHYVANEDESNEASAAVGAFAIMLAEPDDLTYSQQQLRAIGDAQLSAGLPSILGIPRAEFGESGAEE